MSQLLRLRNYGWQGDTKLQPSEASIIARIRKQVSSLRVSLECHWNKFVKECIQIKGVQFGFAERIQIYLGQCTYRILLGLFCHVILLSGCADDTYG